MPRTKEAFESMRDTTRQKIELAALSLFARKGLSVTVSEIAQVAGVSKGLLYNHYPSKEALIAELVRQAVTISAQSTQGTAMADGAADVKIKGIAAMMCEMLQAEDHPGTHYFMLMIQIGMSSFPMEDVLYHTALPNPIESLAQIIAAGQAEDTVIQGDPIELATLFWASIQGLCCYVMTGMPLSIGSETVAGILLKEKAI